MLVEKGEVGACDDLNIKERKGKKELEIFRGIK